MNTLTIVLALGLIACAAAGHGESYVKTSDHANGFGSSYGGYSGDLGHHQEHHHIPEYKFEYGVKDPHTHDHHSQWEHRHGDSVKGEYTLDEADGTKRVVSYYDDGKSGFHAEVKRIGHAHHDAPKKHHESHQESHHHSGNSYSKLYVPSHH